MAAITDIELHLHYVLQQEGVHQMDAKVHNECEKQFLSALDVLKSYTGDFHVEVKVPTEGGVVDEFIIHLLPNGNEVVFTILSALITYYFTKKSSKRDNILKGIDIVEKIKSGSLTEEEAMQLVANDRKLKKIISNYYSSVEREPRVIQIETSSNEIGTNPKSVRKKITRQEFQTHIIETDTNETTQVIEGTTISILSPILQKGHGHKWNGIYSGKTISFKIDDKDFLKQVYNNEVKFGAATIIKCNLQIRQKTTNVEGDTTVKEEYEYIVKDVLTWADDEHYQNETKRYKRIKEEKRQLSLFPDEDF